MKRVPSEIPHHARRVDQEAAETSEFFVDDRRVALVYWHDTGHPDREEHFDDEGRRHGDERYRFPDGRLKWEAHWEHGVQHGPQRQWDERGRLLVETVFHRGTGIDLWFDQGMLAEERHLRAGQRHGVERWWSGDRIASEEHYFEGVLHGISRTWHEGSTVCDEILFYVRGEVVSREQYLDSDDPHLPPYDEADDRPHRPSPLAPEAHD